MYNRKQVKLEAKQALSKNLGMAIVAIILSSAILSAISVVGSLLIVGSVATLIFDGVLSVGLAMVFLAIVRGKTVEFSTMFDGFKNFGPNCVAGILVGLFTALWTMLFIIPGIIKTYSYSMTYYILADHPEMSANEAITASRNMMRGHKWDLFVLQLSFFWWHLLGIITLGIAYIYIMPYMSAATAKFYDTIKGEEIIVEQEDVSATTAQ